MYVGVLGFGVRRAERDDVYSCSELLLLGGRTGYKSQPGPGCTPGKRAVGCASQVRSYLPRKAVEGRPVRFMGTFKSSQPRVLRVP